MARGPLPVGRLRTGPVEISARVAMSKGRGAGGIRGIRWGTSHVVGPGCRHGSDQSSSAGGKSVAAQGEGVVTS